MFNISGRTSNTFQEQISLPLFLEIFKIRQNIKYQSKSLQAFRKYIKIKKKSKSYSVLIFKNINEGNQIYDNFINFLQSLSQIKVESLSLEISLPNLKTIQNIQFNQLTQLTISQENLHSIQALQRIQLKNLTKLIFSTGSIYQTKSIRKVYMPKLKFLQLYVDNLQTSQFLRETYYNKLDQFYPYSFQKKFNSIQFLNQAPCIKYSFVTLLNRTVVLVGKTLEGSNLLFWVRKRKIRSKLQEKFGQTQYDNP